MVEESFSNMMQAKSTTVSALTHASELPLSLLLDQDAEIQGLLEYVDQLEEYHTNKNLTNPMPAFSTPGASLSSLPSPEVPSIGSHTVLMIRSEHE